MSADSCGSLGVLCSSTVTPSVFLISQIRPLNLQNGEIFMSH